MSDQAENELGSAETEGKLVVNSAPKFKKQLESKSALARDPLRLEVQVDACPEPDVKWYKDGQLVQQSDHVKLVKEANGVYALVIDNAAVTDAGSYSCVISNKCGQQTGFAQVSVNEGPGFDAAMSDFAGHAGDTAEFTVKVHGAPRPKVSFMKDGQAVAVDEARVTVVEEEDGAYKLIIKDVTQQDVGRYSCVATNEYGTRECEGDCVTSSTLRN